MRDWRPEGWDNYIYRFIRDRVIGTGEPPTQGDMEFAEAIATALLEALRKERDKIIDDPFGDCSEDCMGNPVQCIECCLKRLIPDEEE